MKDLVTFLCLIKVLQLFWKYEMVNTETLEETLIN